MFLCDSEPLQVLLYIYPVSLGHWSLSLRAFISMFLWPLSMMCALLVSLCAISCFSFQIKKKQQLVSATLSSFFLLNYLLFHLYLFIYSATEKPILKETRGTLTSLEHILPIAAYSTTFKVIGWYKCVSNWFKIRWSVEVQMSRYVEKDLGDDTVSVFPQNNPIAFSLNFTLKKKVYIYI